MVVYSCILQNYSQNQVTVVRLAFSTVTPQECEAPARLGSYTPRV